MNLILNLPPETEARLRQAAEELGKPPEAVALDVINEGLAFSIEPRAIRSREAWIAEFREWLDSHPASQATTLDDSREAIYKGCGE